MSAGWPSWDLQGLLALNGGGHPAVTAVMRAVSNVDNWVPLILLAVVGLLWMGRTRPVPSPVGGRGRRFSGRNPRTVLLCLILAVSLSDQACYHMKRAVGRQRPCFDPEVAHLVEYRGEVYGNRSFPSSHAANSAALAAVTAFAWPVLAVPAALAALLVGTSRVYLGVHYPLDVLTGWGVGILCASIVWLALGRSSRRAGLVGFANRFRFRQPRPSLPSPVGWIEMDLVSLDGHPMKGLFREGGRDLAVLVHGLHEDVRALSEPSGIFLALGFSVLAVPLRGHDGHPVPVTTGGPAEAYDLLGALECPRIRAYGRRRTLLYGSSMGAAVVMKAAGLLGEPLGGVIAHAPYESFRAAAARRLGRIRSALLMGLLPGSARRGLAVFRPRDYAGTAGETPFVLLCGASDRISPPSLCAELAGCLPGTTHLVAEEAGHPVWIRAERFTDAFRTVLGEAVSRLSGNPGGLLCVDESCGVRNLRDVPGERNGQGGA